MFSIFRSIDLVFGAINDTVTRVIFQQNCTSLQVERNLRTLFLLNAFLLKASLAVDLILSIYLAEARLIPQVSTSQMPLHRCSLRREITQWTNVALFIFVGSVLKPVRVASSPAL